MDKSGRAELLVFAAFAAIALAGLMMVLGNGATGSAVRTVKTATSSGSLQMTPPTITIGGIPATVVFVGGAADISSTLTNPQSISQPFAFVLDARDSTGATATISWITGTLAPGETRKVHISWAPSLVGMYQVNVQLPATPPSVTLGKSLAPGASIPVTVTSSTVR